VSGILLIPIAVTVALTAALAGMDHWWLVWGLSGPAMGVALMASVAVDEFLGDRS
jgi:hypothetical protein